MDRTKNGEINKFDHPLHRKRIVKLETDLQKAKTALSIAKSNNKALKLQIDDRRRNKLMNLQILFTLVNFQFKISIFQTEGLRTNHAPFTINRKMNTRVLKAVFKLGKKKLE